MYIQFGEVLEKNGYKNYLMIGSDSTFGGRKSYFEQHGNYEIFDVNTAIETGKMSNDDYVWWGYDDSDLITYAKEKILEISKKDKPFNFTMLTVDTHFPDGYICSKCEEIYESQYSNVIACSSKQIGEFVKWIQTQEFYDNTTIVIVGDHISMQNSIEEAAGENYERTTYNAIINPNKNLNLETLITKNRLFTALDMYPTTLAALGANITGERLGLGTNLFSDKKTLMEEYGKDYFREEIEKKSNFYNSYFAFDKN